ncbi:cilia- and flagella-associated protein 52 [Teleopsis dalmanni]|uniref:cilia- and flagella-associated protein 52 n=1 Tax=Teleopsis dalmanni TaxID=139649 RepID=UPI0018CDBAA7|nr:cilia- and flagella-associated protein 52 [Teleopsis dalmanni]
MDPIIDAKRDPTITLLQPRAIFGLNGSVVGGVQIHKDNNHLLYPIGSKIAIADLKTNAQTFLSGHNKAVSCLDISPSGRFIASGQVNHMGFRAHVILWDWEKKEELTRHDLHKVCVQSLSFSAEDKYLISLGGEDDRTVIVFDVATYTPFCRSNSSRGISGNPLHVRSLHHDSSFFVTAGDRHLRLWSILQDQKKLHVHDIHVGKHQRTYTDIEIDECDEILFLGTLTGDLVKVKLNCCDKVNVTKPGHIAAMIGSFGTHYPRKPYGRDCLRYGCGIRRLVIVDKGLILIGAGDGTVELVDERPEVTMEYFKSYPSPTWPVLRTLKTIKVNGPISSLVKAKPYQYFISTEKNEIYYLLVKDFSLKLLKTCHNQPVYSIVFPRNLSSVFATGGHENIRIWSATLLQELLRIMVYNFQCSALAFAFDGSSIVSVWNDGVIRAFTPLTGRLIYAIPNAHNKGCSALAVSKTGRIIVTGGIEGQVRVWKIEPFRQSLVAVLKDHSGSVTCLDFNHLDTEVISSSSDGSCVIWDINRMTRKKVFTANTQFMTARYYPTGVQVLTCGSDGCINYWMVYNGSLLREIEGSRKYSMNCVSISSNGGYFCSAGSDQTVKFWDYNRGIVLCTGVDHASAVISCTMSPCGKFCVSGCLDGTVIVWNIPEEYWYNNDEDTEKAETTSLPKTDSKSKFANVESKVITSSLPKIPSKENVDDLQTKKHNGVICVDCPAVDKTKMPDLNEQCNYVPDVKC